METFIMYHRREFLTRSLRSSSLVALSAAVPQFVARTAQAAAPGKDTILVVVELTGGNDGLNTVIPYADDLYHKARPTLSYGASRVLKLDDHVGLHPGLGGFKQMWDDGKLAVVQGVGYPNPDRSHFEAMDIWHSADPKRATPTGWIGRTAAQSDNKSGGIPIIQIGSNKLPLALVGAPGAGAVTIGQKNSFKLDLGPGSGSHDARRKLIADLAKPAKADDDLLSFVQQRQVQTLTAVEHLRELLEGPKAIRAYGASLMQKLQLVAGLIQRGFGTRLFYVNLEGFDTHAGQSQPHQNLMNELADAVRNFFDQLKFNGDAERVRVMTFSEFGRRVQENSSRGTDHGAASCLFVAGAAVKGGVVGKHPSLADLDAGDLKYHTDFRRVYASQLEWLACDAEAVLGGKWDPLPGLGAKK
jgi:uncharacterized protein (DUF1501 family)